MRFTETFDYENVAEKTGANAQAYTSKIGRGNESNAARFDKQFGP